MRIFFILIQLILILGPISAQEEPVEGIPVGNITVTVRWYDKLWEGRNPFPGKITKYSEVIHEVSFDDPGFIPVQFDRWISESLETAPQYPPVREGNRRLVLPSPYLRVDIGELRRKFGYNGRIRLGGDCAVLVNQFVKAYNNNDPDFVYIAYADVDIDHEEITGQAQYANHRNIENALLSMKFINTDLINILRLNMFKRNTQDERE